MVCDCGNLRIVWGNMNRYFVDPWEIKDDTILISDEDDIKHIARVLRLKAGDRLEVSDKEKFEYEGEITGIHPDEITVKILNKQKFSREPRIKVTLYQGLPKHGKMEVIVQKSVELGVHSIVPMYTERTVISGRQKNDKKSERWNRISMEAAKQCKRGIIPEVKESIDFHAMIKELGKHDTVIFPYENESMVTIKDVLRKRGPEDLWIDRDLALIIGPEGGFSNEEASLIVKNGGVSVSLGKTILRTETAGPAALAMLSYELEL